MAGSFVMWRAGGGPAPPPPDTSGFVQQGSTAHFNVFYDPSIGTGAQLAAAVLQTAERDYQPIWATFGIGDPAAYLPFNVFLVPGTDGAGHNLPNLGDMYVTVFDGTDADLVRMLLVAEVVEVFEYVQNVGWDLAKSNGEALSRVLAVEMYPTKLPPDFVSSPVWLGDRGRPDWVSNTKDSDIDYTSVGCGVLFLYFLRYHMFFSWPLIVRFGGPTLAQTYQTLTGGAADAFAVFSELMSRHYPPGSVPGLTNDNPFPLGGCAAISSEPGRLDVFTRDWGVVAHLRYPSQDGWFSLTGTHGSAWENYPAAVSWGPQRADVFARNQDGKLAHWWSADDMMTFADPEALGNWTLTSAPAAVSTGDSRLDVFAMGYGGTLLHWRYPQAADGGPFSAGEVISGSYQLFSPPGAVATPVTIHVFGVGVGGVLLHWYSQDDGITFTGPEIMPGSPQFGMPRLGIAQPAVVAGPETLDVFATDYAGIIWRWSYHPEATGSTEPFLSQMDAVICGRPSAVMWPSAGPGASPVLHLFGRAPDGSLLHWSTGAGLGIINPSENLGGTATSPPAVTAWAGGRLDVFGEAPDHSVCHWWLGDAGWGLEGLPA